MPMDAVNTTSIIGLLTGETSAVTLVTFGQRMFFTVFHVFNTFRQPRAIGVKP